MDRAAALEEMRDGETPFDVLIVGGGASGLGAAVDAAQRGHRVALIEQCDFAKGTSSRSTKLVHGGVRYLRQGNLSLVMEALRERGRLTRNAPHLVHSQAFVIPNYTWWEGPFYGIGMKVYDRLAGKLGLAPSRWLGRKETLQKIPTAKPENLVGGVLYHDGQFDDARLAVHLAMTAADHGAVMANYCRCLGLRKEKGRICGAEVRDEESGEAFSLRARAVINATGVFVDDLRRQDDPEVAPMVTVSQGIHLVVPRHFLPGEAAIMVPKTADGRVLFAVPWQGCVVLGTTDTPRSEAVLEPRAVEEERDFIMTHAERYLSKAPGPEDVLSIFAGLRPLVRKGKDENTAKLSRDHSMEVSESGLITLTGGKWTTYRKMAEDVVDLAQERTGLPKHACGTADLGIHGAPSEGETGGEWALYGTDGVEIQNLIAADPSLAGRLHPDLPYCRAEVIWQVRAEMARTVEDVLARRTRALLLNASASIAAAPLVADLMARELNRDAAWVQKQIVAYTSLAEGYCYRM
ncbi:MAG: glycerol-3-phosphate dehydrogenase/oxidase [Opitutales bacterium]|nr:glycerol-3-phosphate dehydrogenase/oxidase [Opitutales bacterium]